MSDQADGSAGTAKAAKEPKRPAAGAAVAGGVVGINLVLWTALPFLIVFAGWTGISIYALVKLIGSAPDEPNPVVILLLFVGIVAAFVTLFAGAVSLIGKLGDPQPKRKRRG